MYSVYQGMANVCANYRPIKVSYHFQTLYHRPRSSPQVTILLPVEATWRHYQDQISRGRENKQTKIEKDTLGEHIEKAGGEKRKHKIISYSRFHEKQNLTCVLSK